MAPASALELLKRLIEAHGSNPFTPDTDVDKGDVAVWMEHGVIGECNEGIFVINSTFNKRD
jgi:hypothetical protein